MSFTEFYKGMGFDSYPFNNRTYEKENNPELFVAPPDYSILNDTFTTECTAIVSGNRGIGKTIVLMNIMSKSEAKESSSYIDNFETVALSNNILDFYSLILQNVVGQVLVHLSKNRKKYTSQIH